MAPGLPGDSVIPKVARNGFLVEGFGVYNSIGMPQFAPNGFLVEGFGPFGATFRNLQDRKS